MKIKLVIKRNRVFRLLREEVRELFPEDLIHGYVIIIGAIISRLYREDLSF